LFVGALEVRSLERKVRARVGRDLGAAPRLTLEHGFFGNGYGRGNEESDEAVRLAANVGLHLEPTYTGKAMAALLAHAKSGKLDGKRVLFIQTYNGVDLQPLLARSPGPAALPPAFRRLFNGKGP
jgi:1-aminocyclopropane-1-carboxylate deaminase/D-cysteine desulfhydrase-like pyridoxal-dependent ACC family enzyme